MRVTCVPMTTAALQENSKSCCIHSRRTAQSVFACDVQPGKGGAAPRFPSQSPPRSQVRHSIRCTWESPTSLLCHHRSHVCSKCTPHVPGGLGKRGHLAAEAEPSSAGSPAPVLTSGKGKGQKAEHPIGGGYLNINQLQERWQCFDQHARGGHAVQQAESHLIRITESTCF